MRILISILLLTLSSGAMACDIFLEPGHNFKGEMMTTGSGDNYVANFEIDDATPYPGGIMGNTVYVDSKPIGTVSGNQFSDGKTTATYANLTVKDAQGNVIGTADNRYNDCSARVVLAGVEIFTRVPYPSPRR